MLFLPEVFCTWFILEDHFWREDSVFSAFGLTVDTCCCQSTKALIGFPVSTSVYSDRAVDSRPALRVAGFTGDDTSRAVFLVCLRAQDARHRCRYGPQGIFRALLPRRSHARCVQRQVPLVLETVQAQFSDKVARARVVLRHVPMVPERVQAQFSDTVARARFVQRHVPMVLETVDGG